MEGDIRQIGEKLEITMGNDHLSKPIHQDVRLKFLLVFLAKAITTFTGKSEHFSASSGSFGKTKQITLTVDSLIKHHYEKSIITLALKYTVQMNSEVEAKCQDFLNSFYGKSSIDALKSIYKGLESLAGGKRNRGQFIQNWIIDAQTTETMLYNALVTELDKHLTLLISTHPKAINVDHSNYDLNDILIKLQSTTIGDQILALYRLIKVVRDDQEHHIDPASQTRFIYYNNQGNVIVQVTSRILMLAYLRLIKNQIEPVSW